MTEGKPSKRWGAKLSPPLEKVTHSQIAQTLRIQYPDLTFFSDSGSGAYFQGPKGALTKARINLLSSKDDAQPDLFIPLPYFDPNTNVFFAGLFVELKREGEKLFNKNGGWRTDHIREQAETLERLRRLGYSAEFAIGYEPAMKLINDYIKKAKFFSL